MPKKIVREEKEEDELIQAATEYNYDFELEEQSKQEETEPAAEEPKKEEKKTIEAHNPKKKKSSGKAKKIVLTILGVVLLAVVLLLAKKLVAPLIGSPGDATVATVNGVPITQSELMTKYMMIPSFYKPAVTKEILLNQSIIEKLLYHEAAANGFSASDGEVNDYYTLIVNQSGLSEMAFEQQLWSINLTKDALLAVYKERLAIGKFLNATITSTLSISEADIENFYNLNSARFITPEQVKASHILVDSETKAHEVLARLKNNEDFATTAMNVSEDKASAVAGGDLGYFSYTDMVKEFADAAFSLQEGELSAPVKTQFGYHIIKVTGKRAAGQRLLKDVAPQIQQALIAQKQQDTLQIYISNLMKNAEIIILQDEFKQKEAPITPAIQEMERPVVVPHEDDDIEEEKEEETEPAVAEPKSSEQPSLTQAPTPEKEEMPQAAPEEPITQQKGMPCEGAAYYYASWCSACMPMKSFVEKNFPDTIVVEEGKDADLKKCIQPQVGFPQVICLSSQQTIKGSLTESQVTDFLKACA